MKSSLSLFVLITAVLFCSCSIQKRHYMKGYNLSINNLAVDDKNSEVKEEQFVNYSASIDDGAPALALDKISVFDNTIAPQTIGDSCDVIKLKNSKLIKAKVQEINIYEVKFRLCDARGVGKTELTVARDKVQSIWYSNGVIEELKSAIDNANGACYDTILNGSKKLYGIIREIGSEGIIYDALLYNGEFERALISKAAVKKICFCGGFQLTNVDLKRLNINITDRNKITDPLFWEQFQYDVIEHKDQFFGNPINGFITEIAADSIKFILSDLPNAGEVAISTKKIKEVRLYNDEIFLKYELIKLKNKISTRTKVIEYAMSIERKERVVKELTARSFKMAFIGIVLPVIGLIFASESANLSTKARRMIKATPELKKYKKKANLASLLATISIVFSGIYLATASIFLLLTIWWGI